MPEFKQHSLSECIQFIDKIKKNYVNILIQDSKRLSEKNLKQFLETAELYLSTSRYLTELEKLKEKG